MLPRRPPPKQNRDFQRPRVVFQPQTTLGIRNGVNQLLNAIRPTLGPLPRQVAIQPAISEKIPELLDSGGTIARRIIQIPDRDQDVGLMFARHMLWKLQEKIGDGTATAAVLFQEILNQGIQYKVAGGDAMGLTAHLQDGLRLILKEIDRQTTPITGPAQLTELAESICYDVELAEHLGQVFDILGPYGRLEVRIGRRREIRHEYVQGVYWDGSPVSPEMLTNRQELRTVLSDGAVLATDLALKTAQESIAILDTALSAGIVHLLLIAESFEDQALAPILEPKNREKIKVLAVKTPGTGLEAQSANLIDIAMLTGGRPVIKATNARPEDVKEADFGFARRVWAYKDSFGITSGKGDPAALRDHVRRLQDAYWEAEDTDDFNKLLKRLGHLMNGSATLWIGALTEEDYQRRRDIAQHTARALRIALMEGVVPGGGVALLGCLPIVRETMRQSTDPDFSAAFRMLARALEAPFRVLMENSGYEPGHILAQLEASPPGYGFDLRDEQIVDMSAAGIVDPSRVMKEAVHSAVSSAALLLTTDVLIHKRNPIEALQTA